MLAWALAAVAPLINTIVCPPNWAGFGPYVASATFASTIPSPIPAPVGISAPSRSARDPNPSGSCATALPGPATIAIAIAAADIRETRSERHAASRSIPTLDVLCISAALHFLPGRVCRLHRPLAILDSRCRQISCIGSPCLPSNTRGAAVRATPFPVRKPDWLPPFEPTPRSESVQPMIRKTHGEAALETELCVRVGTPVRGRDHGPR